MAPFFIDERKKWLAEFEKLGTDGVRSAVLVGKWPKDKRNEARLWLEQHDIANWQKSTATGGGGGMRNFRSRLKTGWLATAIAVIFGLIALARVLRRL